jgi:hypothetical protein
VHAVLISEEYRQQQKQLHDTGTYGVRGGEYAGAIARVIDRYKVTSLVDYGAGSRLSLLRALREQNLLKCELDYRPYEPAVERFSAPPEPADMVACVDVLEHIEPDCLDSVLDDLQRCTKRVGFFTVSSTPALKILPDGRNAHLIQEQAEWWFPKIMSRFQLQTFMREPDGFMVIVTPVGHHGT